MEAGGSVRPAHPGEILLHEFLPDTDIQGFADAMERAAPGMFEMIDARRFVDEFIQGDWHVTPFVSVALSEVTGTTYEFWMNLQKQYDESLPPPAPCHDPLCTDRNCPGTGVG